MDADFVVGKRAHDVGEDEESGIAEKRALFFVLLTGLRKRKSVRSNRAGLCLQTRQEWREA